MIEKLKQWVDSPEGQDIIKTTAFVGGGGLTGIILNRLLGKKGIGYDITAGILGGLGGYGIKRLGDPDVQEKIEKVNQTNLTKYKNEEQKTIEQKNNEARQQEQQKEQERKDKEVKNAVERFGTKGTDQKTRYTFTDTNKDDTESIQDRHIDGYTMASSIFDYLEPIGEEIEPENTIEGIDNITNDDNDGTVIYYPKLPEISEENISEISSPSPLTKEEVIPFPEGSFGIPSDVVTDYQGNKYRIDLDENDGVKKYTPLKKESEPETGLFYHLFNNLSPLNFLKFKSVSDKDRKKVKLLIKRLQENQQRSNKKTNK